MNNLKINRQAVKIALYFAIVGIVWILFSDKLVMHYINDIEKVEQIQIIKGWLFVVITSLFIFLLINNQLRKIHRKNIDLAKSLLRYRSTLDNMMEGAQIIDFNWNYIYVNDVAAQHGKKPKRELLGKAMMESYPGIEKTELFKQLQKCMHERKYKHTQNEFTFPDGSVGWFELSIQPVPEGIFILSYDISERVKAEKELKVGEQRLVEAQRIAKTGDFTWDVNSGEVTWSDVLYEILGYNKNEIINFHKVNEEIHHPDDRQKINKWLTDSVNSDSDTLSPKEYRLIKKDGEVIFVITQGKIIRSNNQSVKVFATVQDITERKKAQEELKESRRKLATLMGNLPGMAYHCLNKPGWPMDFVSEGCYELTGYTSKDLTEANKINYGDLIHPDDKQQVWNTVQKAINDKKSFIVEYRIKHKDGSVHWVWEQGLSVAIDMNHTEVIEGFITDITARKKAEEEIKEHREHLEKLVEERTENLYKSEEKYRGLYESIKDGLLHINMDGKIIECNPEFAKMLGYTKSELKNLTLKDITPPKWRDQLPFIINDQILEKGYSDEFEKEYWRKDGSLIPVAIRAWLVKDKKGKPESIWKIIRNITKHKEYENFITTLNENLQTRQKELEMANSELEAFAYSVSHDLRAPLRAIHGFTNILLEEYIENLDDEAKRIGTVIQENSKKMGQLIDDLLAFSRMGRTAMHFSTINMKNMADSIFHEATLNKDKTQIKFQVSDLPKIKGDPNMMRHVWMNLIANALKYSSPREKIEIKILAEEKKDQVIYSIKDNGVGFDMKHKEKLFGVFQRLHSPREFEGTGVGLALVQRIINRHGGEVWADAELNKGAQFYFSLPKR